MAAVELPRGRAGLPAVEIGTEAIVDGHVSQSSSVPGGGSNFVQSANGAEREYKPQPEACENPKKPVGRS